MLCGVKVTSKDKPFYTLDAMSAQYQDVYLDDFQVKFKYGTKMESSKTRPPGPMNSKLCLHNKVHKVSPIFLEHIQSV